MSNGDVGYEGRSERKRCNATGTTHGGIEQIGGKWYVFYHRLTHGSDYSRQMCAEPLNILPDGSIAQVEMTSSGLNGGDLPGMGEYPAVICCNLTDGKMPHIANQIRENIPAITHYDTEWYVGNAAKGTQLGYKYFFIQDNTVLRVTARGKGRVHIKINGRSVGSLPFHSEKRAAASLTISQGDPHAALCLTVTEGSLDILSLHFSTVK